MSHEQVIENTNSNNKVLKTIIIIVGVLITCIIIVYLLNLLFIHIEKQDTDYDLNHNPGGGIVSIVVVAVIGIISWLLGYLPWHHPFGCLIVYAVIILYFVGKGGGGHSSGGSRGSSRSSGGHSSGSHGGGGGKGGHH